ncbi:alpha/beta fold hydrolase [Flammeovirgaceae bacterium SG7u.111]|nr:alpha/beta fold hydrolase [Flammeovirgaceae bacterium SG7u.132]WPO35452.1 alpha/beta fold hydrolase [Flammeovirgaceae bacterium SG7u.111]
MEPLNYTESGDGQVVVLIHGFCENKKLWEAFSALLSMKYRVITLDLPGFGESGCEFRNPSLEDFADKVEATLGLMDIENAIVIGHSLGGYTTLAYADKYPKRLMGFGLFHSTSFADKPEKKEIRTKAIEFIKNNGTEKFVTSFFPALFAPANREVLKNQINYFVKDASSLPELSLTSTMAAMRERPDRRDVLSKAEVPVLFIVGKEDGSVPLAQSMEEAALPKDCSVHILDGVGHMGMIEAREQTLLIIDNFIKYCVSVNTL